MRPPPSTSTDWLSGIIADLPTPFDDSNELDLTALTRLCERQIAAGAPAIIVGETAGEAATLTPREHETLVRAAVSTARGRIRVIAGAGSNSTSQAIELTRRAETAGADAVMSVVPYYNKPTQAGIEAHFRAIVDSSALPIVLHDTPGRTVRALSDETVIRLAQSSRIVGLADATGDVARPRRLRAALSPEFRLLTGDDATMLAYLTQGGDGCISNIANIVPELCRELYRAYKQDQPCYATSLQDRLAPLVEVLPQEVTPGALKYALSVCGLMAPCVRLPMIEIDGRAKQTVDAAINRVFENAIHQQAHKAAARR